MRKLSPHAYLIARARQNESPEERKIRLTSERQVRRKIRNKRKSQNSKT